MAPGRRTRFHSSRASRGLATCSRVCDESRRSYEAVGEPVECRRTRTSLGRARGLDRRRTGCHRPLGHARSSHPRSRNCRGSPGAGIKARPRAGQKSHSAHRSRGRVLPRQAAANVVRAEAAAETVPDREARHSAHADRRVLDAKLTKVRHSISERLRRARGRRVGGALADASRMLNAPLDRARGPRAPTRARAPPTRRRRSPWRRRRRTAPRRRRRPRRPSRHLMLPRECHRPSPRAAAPRTPRRGSETRGRPHAGRG